MLKFEEKGNETIVFFKILDKIPLIGDVVNPVMDITLNDAYTVLKQAVSSNRLNVTVNGIVSKSY